MAAQPILPNSSVPKQNEFGRRWNNQNQSQPIPGLIGDRMVHPVFRSRNSNLLHERDLNYQEESAIFRPSQKPVLNAGLVLEVLACMHSLNMNLVQVCL